MTVGNLGVGLALLLLGVAALRADDGVGGAAEVVPGCLDASGDAVDWWVMLKQPRGYQYSYLDSRSVAHCTSGLCWRHLLSMLRPNPVSTTLEVLRTANASIAHVLYNDEEPAGIEHFEHGHAKGVVAFNAARAFWLIHSAPRFPDVPTAANFSQLQHPQSYFAQHFSCFTLNSSSITSIAQLLLRTWPYVYSHSLPLQLALQYPLIQELIYGGNRSGGYWVQTLSTTGGQDLLGLSKTGLLHDSIQESVIEPVLGTSMLWETWRNSGGVLPSLCPPERRYSSRNINQLHFPLTVYGWHWTQDHSKWGISDEDQAKQFVCLGDMNRAVGQFYRGGGFVCMQHRYLWNAFFSLVESVEDCKSSVHAS